MTSWSERSRLAIEELVDVGAEFGTANVFARWGYPGVPPKAAAAALDVAIRRAHRAGLLVETAPGRWRAIDIEQLTLPFG